MPAVQIRTDGDKVILVVDGKGLSMPWEKALEIAGLLRDAGKRAEEIAKADNIIADHALLTRAGVPIGLSSHPKIMDEVRKEAAHNRELRRALPGGVKAAVVFGAPAVRHAADQSISPGGIASTAELGKF